MAIPVVESTSGATYYADATQNFVIGKPPGTVEGDLLVAFVGKDTSTGSWASAPAGWTEEIGIFASSTLINFAVYWKIAGASEPANYTWTYSTTTGSVFAGGILRISGAHATAPIHKKGNTAGGATRSAICPAVSTTVVDCLILRLMLADDNSYTNNNTPAGHTILWADDSSRGRDITSGAARVGQADTGDSGTASFTGFTATERWCTATLAIAPVAGGPPPAVTGTVDQSQQPQTSAAIGGQTFSGTGSANQEPQDQAIIGSLIFAAEGVQSQELQVQDVQGTLSFSGDMTQDQELQEQDAVGEIEISGFTGTVDQSQQSQVGTAQGSQVFSGTAASFQESQNGTAQGSLIFLGTVAQEQQPQIQVAEGTVEVAGFAGTIDQGQQVQIHTAQGAESFIAEVLQGQQPQVQISASMLAFIAETIHEQQKQQQEAVGELSFLAEAEPIQEPQKQIVLGGVVLGEVGESPFVGIAVHGQELQSTVAEGTSGVVQIFRLYGILTRVLAIRTGGIATSLKVRGAMIRLRTVRGAMIRSLTVCGSITQSITLRGRLRR